MLLNDFDRYKESKKCLYKMVNQFLTSNLPNDNKEVCYHNFTGEGLLAWSYLGLKDDYITHEEIYDLINNIKNEKEKENTDYRVKYLKNRILLIDLTKKYYKKEISVSEAIKNNVPFDKEKDVEDDQVNICFNYYEGAGETVWNLFDLDNAMVGESIFDNIRYYDCRELSGRNKAKIKKYK